MPPIELLSPAGSFEALIAANSNGADAVYLGSKLFNARRLANNFNSDELKKAVQYAHLHNVKVYLTLNTLIKNQEIKPFLNQLAIADQLGIDAVIVQDLSFAPIIKQHFPKIEVHASTQATIMNSPSIEFWRKYVDLFVLARELTKEEVKHIANTTKARLEVFVHGHLCISYSGQCLISSLIGKRSGNRGLCASSCRKQYNGDQYLLSAKDLSLINSIPDLIESGVSSLKIEGRMKPPEYVATTTRYYRQQINAYYKKKYQAVSEKTMNTLKLAFNRNFTAGFFNNEKSIVDPLIASKRGIPLGIVRRNTIILEHDLQLFDGVTTVYKGKAEGDFVKKIIVNDVEVPSAKQGQEVTLLIPGFSNGATVFLTAQHHGENLLGEQRKIPFAISTTITKNKPIEISISINNKTITYPTSIIAQEAQKHPLSQEEVIQELQKYTSGIFQIKNINVNTDSSFIPKSVLTKLRNDLDQYLLDQLEPITAEKKSIPELIFSKTTTEKSELHVRVFSIEAIKEAVKAEPEVIYYDAFAKDLEEAQKIVSQSKSKFYLHTPMVLTDNDCEKLKEIFQRLKPAGILVNNVGALNLDFNGDIILGYQMNIFNDQQLQFYNKRAVASIELNTQELNLFQNKKPLLYYAHGRPVVMTFKEQFRQNSLTDQKQYTFPLRKTTTATEMLYSKPIGLLQHTPEILNTGITSFYLEIEKDVFNLITLYKELLAGKNVTVRQYQGEVTIGNLTKGVM